MDTCKFALMSCQVPVYTYIFETQYHNDLSQYSVDTGEFDILNLDNELP
jgi:hypothetical protein